MSLSNDPHNRQTYIITGATGAIGEAIARGIAAQADREVVLIARNEPKAQQTTRRISEATGNSQMHYLLADLSRRAEVYALAEQWQGPLHGLINNAATSPRQRQETAEGIEMQFAVNVLSYFWMTRAFTPHLKASAPARVVNVASYWAGDLDIDDLEFKRRTYRNGAAYRQSKQANRMLTVAFAERLRAESITVNSCHPGDVNSTLSNDLGFGGSQTPEQGAATPVWLATAPEVESKTGRYFAHQREEHCRFSGNKHAIEALYQACLRYQ